MFNVSNWLLGYRNTIHPSTGKESSLAMFGRKTRTAMSLLNPLSNKQLSSKDINDNFTGKKWHQCHFLPIIFNGYLQYVDIIQGVKTSHDFVEFLMQF